MSETKFATCALCEATCGIQVRVEAGVAVEVRGDPEDPFSKGHVCPKATALMDLQTDPDRVRRPLRRTATGFEPVPWDEALDDIADRIHALQNEFGSNAMAAYLGNPMVHNLGAMMFVPMFLRTLRTQNKYSATSLDQLPHMLASSLMFGHELLMPVPDVDRTDFLIVLGANPVVSQGSIMTAPGIRRRLRQVRDRGHLVVVDPRRTETAALAHEHHFIHPGTDGLWLLGLLKCVLELGPPRLLHLADHVRGLEALAEVARRVDLDRVAEQTGIDVETTRALARRLRETPRAALYSRLGACAQEQGGLAAWLAYTVNAVSGHLDVPGGLMFTDPAFDAAFPPGSGPRRERRRFGRFRSRVRGLPEFAGELPTSALAEEIDTPGDGQVRGLIVWGGNPALSSPDSGRLARGLGSLDLCVVVDLYVNETAAHAHYVLPAVPPLGRDHYDLAFHMLAVRNTAKFSPAVVGPEPGDHARPDWQIALDLIERLDRKRGAGWSRRLRMGALRRLGPRGLLAAGLRMKSGLTLRHLQDHPHGVDLGPLRSCLLARSPRDHVDLAPTAFLADLDRVLKPRERPPAVLIGRRDLRSHNSWLHNVPRLMKGKDRCTLLVHPQDAAKWALQPGGEAVIRSSVGEVRATVDVTDAIMPGVVSLPHGWGHRAERASWQQAKAAPGANANLLTDGSVVDPLSGNAVLNGVPVSVRPAQ